VIQRIEGRHGRTKDGFGENVGSLVNHGNQLESSHAIDYEHASGEALLSLDSQLKRGEEIVQPMLSFICTMKFTSGIVG